LIAKVPSRTVNQVKTRLQALGLLERSFAAATDDEIAGAIAALDDDHRDALAQLVGAECSVEDVRGAISRGRLDGTVESVALVVTDACLADAIKELGDHAEHPTTDQLREVLPGIVERHGLGLTRMMLASTVAGEAPASAIIRDLLKHDDLVKLPPAEDRPLPPIIEAPEVDPEERAALKAKRKEMRERKQAAARAAREQAAKARNRA
jgi:hypothetical protein